MRTSILILFLATATAIAQPIPPRDPRPVASLPATCSTGQTVFLTSGSAKGIYACRSANAWTYSGNGGTTSAGWTDDGTTITVTPGRNVAIGATVSASNLAVPVKGVGDGVVFTDCSISSGSAILTCPAETFTSADVGKLIEVFAAGGSTTVGTAFYPYTTGLATLTAGGTYTGQANRGYCVKATATDHFSWGAYGLTTADLPSCTNGAASVAITGAAQSLSNGVTVTFGSTTGYTTGSVWIIPATVGVLATTIAGYTSAHVVTLTAPATATVASGGVGAYGTDNATAIAAALAAIPASGGTVLFPAGKFLTSTAIVIRSSFVGLAGVSPTSTVMYAGSGAVNGVVEFGASDPANNFQWQNTITNLTIRGNSNAVNALLMKSTHHSMFAGVRLMDAQNCFTSQWAVSNRYDWMACSANPGATVASEGWMFAPINGFVLDAISTDVSTTAAWTGIIAEHIISTGIYLKSTLMNAFVGGTSETNGVALYSTVNALRDAVDSLDFEANIIDVAGAGVTEPNIYATVLRNIPSNPDILARGNLWVPNGFNINSRTTGGVVYPIFSPFSDNNLYIGSTAMVGHPVFRTGDGTFNFGGSIVMYRCTSAGALPNNALTVDSANCGTSVDTGFRLK